MTSRQQSRTSPRAAVRTAVSAAAVGVVALVVGVVAALPASAVEGLGTREPSGLSRADTFLIFVGIPALVIALVFALVYATQRNSEPRLREGQAWWAEPEYHSDGQAPAAKPADSGSADAARTTDGGGSGAGW